MKEQNKPKKIGRPRIYKEPMTNAERQQRWRLRVQADAQRLLPEFNTTQKNNENT